MTRKNGILVISLLFLFLIVYNAYEGLYINGIVKYADFLTAYVNNVQKYFFNITLFISGILYFVKVPFLKPEFRIRYGEKIGLILIKNGLKISIFITLYVYLLAIVVPFLIGYKVNIFEISFINIIGLFLFIFYLNLLYTILYILSKNEMFGILGTLSLNFLLLIIFISLNFYVLNGSLTTELELMYLMYITMLLNLLGVLYLLFNLKNKEWLT